MVLILTATVHPADGVFGLTVSDAAERCRQYKEALQYYIENIPGINIVFCDNSDMDISQFDDMVKLSLENNCRLEILSFKGDVQETLKKGKGYGESEIITYALRHSKLVKEDKDKFFVKVTGRLILTNLAKMMPRFNNFIIYINTSIDGYNRTIADTRAFAMNTDYYSMLFETAGRHVDDQNGLFLEKIYYDTIRKYTMPTRNMPYYPRIIGVSGSSGYQYTYKEWKCRIKDLLSRFNHYGIR